jgi:hypothetical protein
MGGCFYLAANLKVDVLVFVAVDFDVTTTVAVQRAPGVKPVIVTLLSAVTLEFDVVNTVLLSASLITVTATVTPAVGIVELNFTLIACEVPTTAKIFPDPGSTFTENAIGDSVGVGVGVGVGVEASPPLLHEKNKIGITNNNNFIDFI